MLLAIDVGNTNTVLGLAGDGPGWQHIWRMSTHRSEFGADWAGTIGAFAARDGFDLARINRICLGSVVPAATISILDYCRSWLKLDPLLVSSALHLNVKLGVANPGERGIDRIANAVAARNFSSEATIIVDLGTATKVKALSTDGAFRGGAIAPGIQVMLEALTSRAARLFSIPLALPTSAIGRDTVSAMQSGIVLGHLKMIEGLIHAIAAELESPDPTVIVTGGHAESDTSPFRQLGIHIPTLTLDGIRLIAALNPD